MNYLLWIDAETTGLDPRRDALLSVGSIITRPNLEVVAEFEADIGFSIPVDGYQIDPFVVDMHTKSGQWERSRKSPLATAEVLKMLRNFWMNNVPGDSKAYVAGSTVWFDREFLTANGFDFRNSLYFPFLQYRMLDVSTFKVIADLAGVPKSKAPEAHRPLPDLRQSIADFRYWLDSTVLERMSTAIYLDGLR